MLETLAYMHSTFFYIDLVANDDYDINNIGYTYEGLGTQSFIDYLLIHRIHLIS